MKTNNDQHPDLTNALDRLAQQDRDAAPDALIETLSAKRTPAPHRALLARITPWLLAAAAAIAVAVPFLTPSAPTPAPLAPEPLALEDTLDPTWLLGEDLTSLDHELAQLALELTAINPSIELELIGEEG